LGLKLPKQTDEINMMLMWA